MPSPSASMQDTGSEGAPVQFVPVFTPVPANDWTLSMVLMSIIVFPEDVPASDCVLKPNGSGLN